MENVKKNDLGINQDFSLCVNSLVVLEFNYLLKYIANECNISQDLSFHLNNWHDIYTHSNQLLAMIDIELLKDTLAEEKFNNVSKETAVLNMENMKGIIEKIRLYEEL